LLSPALGCEQGDQVPPGTWPREVDRYLGTRARGAYTYLAADRRRCVRVSPYQNDESWRAALKRCLDGRETATGLPLAAVVVNLDADNQPGEPSPVTASTLGAWLEQHGHGPAEPLPHGVRLADGVEVHLAIWRSSAPPDAKLPSKQTLERMICAALLETRPTWVESSTGWLSQRPEPQGKLHKVHAAALFAGWYADDGWDYFFRGLWSDEVVASALRRQLQVDQLHERMLALLGPAPEQGLATQSG
jgi:hypothetical protein